MAEWGQPGPPSEIGIATGYSKIISDLEADRDRLATRIGELEAGLGTLAETLKANADTLRRDSELFLSGEPITSEDVGEAVGEWADSLELLANDVRALFAPAEAAS